MKTQSICLFGFLPWLFIYPIAVWCGGTEQTTFIPSWLSARMSIYVCPSRSIYQMFDGRRKRINPYKTPPVLFPFSEKYNLIENDMLWAFNYYAFKRHSMKVWTAVLHLFSTTILFIPKGRRLRCVGYISPKNMNQKRGTIEFDNL